eukprot:COSAG02_NODE_3148_length_7286_cov_24.818700_5_plen_920_part_00
MRRLLSCHRLPLRPRRSHRRRGGQVRGLLARHPELIGLLSLPDSLSGKKPDANASSSELSQEDLQRVLAAACALLLASTSVHPAVLALLHAAPWELSALNTVMTMQNHELPAVPGHMLLVGLRWSEATEHRRAEFLNACHRQLSAAARPRLLQRMFLGNPKFASGATGCTLSLATTFLEQGHVDELVVAIEADGFAGPRFLAQCSVGVAGVQPLLHFLLLGYQHSPRLYIATRDILAAARSAAGRGQHAVQVEAEQMQLYLRSLHGNPSAATVAQPAVEAKSDRDATHLALIEASWVAKVPAGAVQLVRATAREAGSKPEIWPAGLHNLGNTCFANAWLQVLYLAAPFRAALIQAPLSTAAKRPVVALALQRMLASLMLSPRRALDATIFFKAMPTWDCIEGWRSRAQQQDSAEFGQLLLDRVEHEVKGIPGAEGVVSNIFGGVLASTVKCERCGACSASREHLELFCLSIDLPQVGEPTRASGSAKVEVEPTIDTCQLVARHFIAERLDDGEGKPIYRCDGRCTSALVIATKRLVVVEPPSYMMMSLKRFTFDGSAMKVTRRVGLSLWIWLPHEDTPSEAAPPDKDQRHEGYANTQTDTEAAVSAHMSNGASGTEPNEPADEADQVPATMYVLYGVVVHSGTSANSGHYYTYGRQLTHDVLKSSHSSISPVTNLAASLWNHGCAIASMTNSDREGGPGRTHATEAARKLREGLDAVGFRPMQSSAAYSSAEYSPDSILVRLAAELQVLESFAAEDHSTSWHVVAAALQSAVNLLAQYAEATQCSSPPKWWLYNDATVSHVTRGFDALDDLGATNVHETPYLLLYKRCDGIDGEAEDDHLGVDQIPPTVRYAVYNDELSLLKSGLNVAPTKREVVVDRKWAPPPPGGGAGGGAARLPHRFGPAGGGMGGGAMDTPKWGM